MKLKISVAASAVFLFLVSSVFAVIPPAENLLPADTLFMMTVPDWSALRTASQQSPQWLLWGDPAMKPFRDDFTAKWNSKFIAPLEQSLGIRIDDYLPLLQGQLTLAVTQNGWDGSGAAAPAFLLLLDARDKGDLLATNLAGLKDQWTASGKLLRTQTLEGIKFSVVALSSNTPMPLVSSLPHGTGSSSAPSTLFIGQFQSLLIAGTSVKAVDSVAAHLTGGANPALRNNARFAADHVAQFHDAPLYYGWFNAGAFFDVVSQLQPASDSSGFPWDKILLESGLENLKSVSFSYRESRDGAQVEFFAAAPASTRAGLFKIFGLEAKDANPPPFVPVDAVKFSRWRIDGQKSWAELQKALTAISPGLLAGVNSFIAMANATAQQQDPNFDNNKDLFGNLGDDWISYAKLPASSDSMASLSDAPWLFLFAANSPDRAVLSLKTLAGMSSPGGEPQSRDFLGRKIYTIVMPSRAAATPGTPAPPTSVYFTASGGYVAISMDASMIENYLRSDDGKTKPLSQTPGLLEAAQHVGGMDNGLFGYQNQRETVRSLFGALKNDPTASAAMLSPLASLPMFAGGNDLRNLMDFSLLPDYGKVAKYFSFTVYGGSATSEGLDFKAYTPRPPGLN